MQLTRGSKVVVEIVQYVSTVIMCQIYAEHDGDDDNDDDDDDDSK